jgi:predicted metal-dependent HD superfamily phosphohydrolase
MRYFEFSGDIDVQADAKNAWLRLCKKKEEAGRVFDVVFGAQDRNLAYHNTKHLWDCWDFIFRSDAPKRVKDIAVAIILFHDVVYVPGSRQNEKHSAEGFLSVTKRCGLHKSVSDDIEQGVSNTIHTPLSRHICRMHPRSAISLACDADLISLSSSPDVFISNSRQIADELRYPKSGQKFQLATANALIKFLPTKHNPTIYLTEWAASYEVAAIANLRSAIEPWFVI